MFLSGVQKHEKCFAIRQELVNNKTMVDGKMLTEKTKEELIKIILDKDKLCDELAARVKELEEKVKAEQKKGTGRFACISSALFRHIFFMQQEALRLN